MHAAIERRFLFSTPTSCFIPTSTFSLHLFSLSLFSLPLFPQLLLSLFSPLFPLSPLPPPLPAPQTTGSLPAQLLPRLLHQVEESLLPDLPVASAHQLRRDRPQQRRVGLCSSSNKTRARARPQAQAPRRGPRRRLQHDPVPRHRRRPPGGGIQERQGQVQRARQRLRWPLPHDDPC